MHLAIALRMQLRDLEMERRDPRTVVAVILGGGAGTRLFPLTKRRAKPAVSLPFSQSHFSISSRARAYQI